MILIDTILADEALLHQPFLCDLQACKGACCTMPGGRGAPVLDEEVAEIEKARPHAEAYLSERSKRMLALEGGIEGETGDYATVCIDDRDCVFVYFEGDVAKCALERAYNEGRSTFRKPLSCHLFPIRITDFGGEYLHYEKISECAPALEKGAQHNVPMYRMLREALERSYGSAWYDKLQQIAQRVTSDSEP